MRRLLWCIIVLVFAASFTGCSKVHETDALDTSVPMISESHFHNEVSDYLSEKYDMRFVLWCPDGHDLYAFYVFPDHAERKCQIMMPANTADVSEYQKDLEWEVVGDELIFAGEWDESFKINIHEDTALSTVTGKTYGIFEPQSSLN